MRLTSPIFIDREPPSMGNDRRHVPPPTKFGSLTAQSKPGVFLPPPTRHQPPAQAAIQAKKATGITAVPQGAHHVARHHVIQRASIEKTPKYIAKEGKPVIWVKTTDLYSVWQKSQKEDNIRKNSVDWHVNIYKGNIETDPITIESIVFDDDGNMYIRTLDGRHHLLAAVEIGLDEVAVLATETAINAFEAFGISFRK